MRRGLLLLSVVLLAGTRSTGAAGGFTNGQAASVVLGQLDFVTKTAGTSATTLRTPGAVALDTAANVWVADVLNRRVVRFDAPSTTGKAASIVLGQPNFISNTQNNGGRTASSLSDPLALAVDGGGSLWVADVARTAAFSGIHRPLQTSWRRHSSWACRVLRRLRPGLLKRR